MEDEKDESHSNGNKAPKQLNAGPIRIIFSTLFHFYLFYTTIKLAFVPFVLP